MDRGFKIIVAYQIVGFLVERYVYALVGLSGGTPDGGLAPFLATPPNFPFDVAVNVTG